MNPIPQSPPRRDFLLIGPSAIGLTGTALALWPFIDSMNPSADVKALATTEVDISPIEIGQRITVVWRGKPVFIVHRSEEEIKRIRDENLDLVRVPEADEDRVQKAEWLGAIGICTHLGCIPLGQKDGDPVGEYGGWFCPCHGSHYDTAGRIRKGPAPENLHVPVAEFTDANTIKLG